MKTRAPSLNAQTRKITVRFDAPLPPRCEAIKIHQRTHRKDRRKRVFVIDPCPSSRNALTEALEGAHDFTLCGEADNPVRAAKMIEALNPDLIVTEVLCRQNLGFIRALKRRHPRLRILVFSFLDGEDHAAQVLEAGADGFLSKLTDTARVLDGLRDAMHGRLVLSRRVRAQFLAKCLPSRLQTRRPAPLIV